MTSLLIKGKVVFIIPNTTKYTTNPSMLKTLLPNQFLCLMESTIHRHMGMIFHLTNEFS
jgi:hypothetical protein